MYLKHMIRFIVMFPPFLTTTLASKRTTLINLESFTKEEHSSALKRFSHHLISLSFTEVILASSTPITEEHTKLLDRLSEPSSQLIHRVSHPPKEDTLAEVVTACLSASGFTVLPVASLLSVKRASLSSQLLRNCLGSKLLSYTSRFSTSLLCRLCSSILQHLPLGHPCPCRHLCHGLQRLLFKNKN